MNRAYAVLDVKSVDEESASSRGIATTPSRRSVGRYRRERSAPNSRIRCRCCGSTIRQAGRHVIRDKVTKDGIDVRSAVRQVDEPGTLKDRIDEAWQSVKLGWCAAYRSASAPSRLRGWKTYGIRFMKSEVARAQR
jgi:hypothetical protein